MVGIVYRFRLNERATEERSRVSDTDWGDEAAPAGDDEEVELDLADDLLDDEDDDWADDEADDE